MAIFHMLFLLLVLAPPSSIAADKPVKTAVIYPEIREPYRSVFIRISEGVKDELGDKVIIRSLQREDVISETATWIESRLINSVIALGRHGQALHKELPDSIPVILGAVHMSPELQESRYIGITLTPDPLMVFNRLRDLAPETERVHVVYHRVRNAWMIDKAKDAAQQLGIALDARPADNLPDAAKLYQEILANQEAGTDALWLLQNPAVLDERALLPEILKTAWDRKLTVFSSNPAHVKRGVLFALYPDNYNMGRSLAKLALNITRNGQLSARQGLEPLEDLMIAVNIRTGAHLGLNISRHQMRSFDLVFPSY